MPESENMKHKNGQMLNNSTTAQRHAYKHSSERTFEIKGDLYMDGKRDDNKSGK